MMSASGGQNATTERSDASMNMQESARIMEGLRAKGWTDTEIVDFILWVETGSEKYKPKDVE